LVIAMAVILILSGLCLAIMARTVSALGNARVSQDAATAVASADAGIADAVYILDHAALPQPSMSGTVASATWTATCSPAGSGCLLTTAFSATVTSTGHSGTVVRSEQTTLTRSPQWPWLIATAGSLVLDAHVALPTTGVLAAGGALVLRTGVSGGGGDDLLGPGASCSGCVPPAPTVLPATTTLPDPPASPVGAAAPPGGCTNISSLTGGPFLCTGAVTFAAGAVTVTGPVQLYVTNGSGAPATVSFAGSQVNQGGDPSAFVVHVIGAGVITPGDGPPGASGAGSFTGIIDAPRSSLRSADCQFNLSGAANLGSMDCVSAAAGPTLAYDPRVTALPATAWQAGPEQDVSGS
jgi:hypothetical protein